MESAIVVFCVVGASLGWASSLRIPGPQTVRIDAARLSWLVRPHTPRTLRRFGMVGAAGAGTSILVGASVAQLDPGSGVDPTVGVLGLMALSPPEGPPAAGLWWIDPASGAVIWPVRR